MFDFVAYGIILRSARMAKKMRAWQLKEKVEMLCETTVGRDFVYQVEGGRRELTAAQFLAINYTIWGTTTPADVMKGCLKGVALQDYLLEMHPVVYLKGVHHGGKHYGAEGES